MDDYELDRIASDNPALTAPAAQRASISRRKSRGNEATAIRASGSSQTIVASTELTKYDVTCPSSYSPIYKLIEHKGGLAQNSPQLQSILVLRNHGHRHRLSPTHRHTLQSLLASLALCCVFRPQCHPLHMRVCHLRVPLHRVPQNLDRHDRRQRQFLIPRDHTHGLCNAHLRMVFVMYSILGTMGCYVRVGVLDD
jgi:hypothetical protein